MNKSKIALSDAIEVLRDELQKSMDKGEGEKLRFEIQEMELELNYTVSREGEGKAGIKFWLVEAGVGGTIGDSTSQTVRLKLKPTIPTSNTEGVVMLSGLTEQLK